MCTVLGLFGVSCCIHLVYCNCMTTVLCWSLVCCMSSCNGVHLIKLTVYRVSTKECNKIKRVELFNDQD